jgi:uncharacterized protein YbbC (DUF1343 family)
MEEAQKQMQGCSQKKQEEVLHRKNPVQRILINGEFFETEYVSICITPYFPLCLFLFPS